MATKKKRSWPRIGLRVLAGIVLGLAITEAVFHLRDHGAFPHLNVYIADRELGVRLRPLATERVSFGGNPVTSIRINSEGYRGADWGPPGDDEVLVVGDSQTFGLGVEEGETFSDVAARELKRHVLDAGVPTYGPPELERVIAEVLGKRKPKTIVYVVNFVNDPFEARRRNVERHAVWDGWAVRRELAPAEVTSFPLRSLLFRRSHAVFALRQILYEREALRVFRTPSEGGAEDLVNLSVALEKAQSRAADETVQKNEAREAETQVAQLLAINADQRVKQIAFRELKLSDNGLGSGSVYLASGASPGDIVVPQLGEEGSPLGATAEFVNQAAKLRVKIEKELQERALAHATDEASKTTLDALERRDALEKHLRELHQAPVEIVRATQPIVESVLRAKKLAEDHGATFVLLALPMDVQISKSEWQKYGHLDNPPDMNESLLLVRDLVEAVRDAGGIAVDPTEALRAAEPGAFLNHDPHLSPKGHEVVGKALAEALSNPPPKPRTRPLLALPEGRSRLPKPFDWERVGDLLVHGSDAAGCKTQHIREWMLVRCSQRGKGPVPQNVRVLRGGHGEAITLVSDGVVTLIAPVLRGDDFAAKLSWANGSKELKVNWPADLVETDRFLENSKEPPDPPPSIDLAPIVACRKSIGSVDAFIGYPDPDCIRTYGSDCRKMTACFEGNPTAMPDCHVGETNAGASLHCFTTCESDSDCKAGHCIASQEGKLCIAP